jgi:phage gp45-like
LKNQEEIEVECKVTEVQSDSTVTTKQENIKPKAKCQPGRRIPGTTVSTKREPRKTSGKENIHEKNTAKKPKVRGFIIIKKK